MMSSPRRHPNGFTGSASVRLAALFCSAVWLPALAADEASEKGGESPRYLIVRYDDFAPVTLYDRGTHGIEVERRVFDLFARYDARLVVGVVPFPIARQDVPEHGPATTTPADSWLARPDDPWVTLLRQYVDNGTVELALHGFEHRRRMPPGYRPGEFSGRPRQWQFDAIRLGRDALSAAVERPVRVFVPPWNAWDANTAETLAALGFEWLSPDFRHADLPPNTVRAAPQCSADPAAVLAWAHSGEAVPPGSIVVLVTHPFDFYGENGEAYFRATEELLRFAAESPDWQCVGLAELPPASPEQWAQRFATAVAWHRIQGIIADTVGFSAFASPQPRVYRPLDWYELRAQAGTWATVMAMTITCAAAYLAARLASRWLARMRGLLPVVQATATVALLVLLWGAFSISVRGYDLRGLRIQAVFAVGGLCLGLLMGGVRRTLAEDARKPPVTPETPRALRQEPARTL